MMTERLTAEEMAKYRRWAEQGSSLSNREVIRLIAAAEENERLRAEVQELRKRPAWGETYVRPVFPVTEDD